MVSKNARNNRKQSNRSAGGVGKLSAAEPQSVANGKSDTAAILWYSNSPHAATGYGQQTEQVTKRLLADGHAIAISSNYGYEGGAPRDFNGIVHYPRGFETYSNDVVTAHAQHWSMMNPHRKPMLVTLFDAWVLKGKMWDQHTVHSWVPIDHTPCPPEVLNWVKKPNVRPLAMSLHGQTMLAREGVESIYIPHAIEKVFQPTKIFKDDSGELLTGNQIMGFSDDDFVVLMNSANKGVLPNRKSFGEALLAFSIFAATKKDAKLYIHTEDIGSMGGIHLRKLIAALALEDRVLFADQYALRLGYPKEALAAIYSAADVLLAPSMGEGFGIPVIEAQACGTPVIVSNATAQPELVGDGWLVEGQPFWNSPQNAWLHMPSVPSIVDALNAAYDRGKGTSQKAVDFASQFDADKVYQECWEPLVRSYLQESA
jgi:glycosyltransferase involved in cell wall biosynthesis